MKTTYTIVITGLSILAIILCPDQIKEYVMFGLLVMMISINRWETDKILKATKPKTENNSEVLNIPRVSGSAWELPDGVYQVGVDKAAPNSKDHSCRVWMKKGISGEMIIVAEEHYR